jgi:MFS superfamily sulfate permease-like transporter
MNGLCTAAVPMLVYAALASSTKVNAGPASPTAVLIASAVASLALVRGQPWPIRVASAPQAFLVMRGMSVRWCGVLCAVGWAP